LQIAAQRASGALIGAGRAAEAQIDPAGVKRGERAELLRDHERRVIRQHDAARADANRFRAARHVADHDRGRRAGNARHVVMLRQPEALVVPLFRMLGEVERIPERVRRRGARGDRREVEDREGDHCLFTCCFRRCRAMGHSRKGFAFLLTAPRCPRS